MALVIHTSQWFHLYLRSARVRYVSRSVSLRAPLRNSGLEDMAATFPQFERHERTQLMWIPCHQVNLKEATKLCGDPSSPYNSATEDSPRGSMCIAPSLWRRPRVQKLVASAHVPAEKPDPMELCDFLAWKCGRLNWWEGMHQFLETSCSDCTV